MCSARAAFHNESLFFLFINELSSIAPSHVLKAPPSLHVDITAVDEETGNKIP